MKLNYIKKILLLIIFISLNLIANNYFSYKSMITDDEKDQIIISLAFNTEKNIYINSENIKCTLNTNPEMGIIKSSDIIGNIYLKDNKKSFQALSGSGSVECFFKKDKEITISNLQLEYTVFNSKTNSLTQLTEIIAIPLPIEKNTETKTFSLEINRKNNSKIINTNSSFLDTIINKTKNSHFLLIAIVTLILGILMSLTPCIYPMIPITIGILGIDKKSFSERLYSGILYMLGISLTFSLFGMLAASGKLFFGQLLSIPFFTIITTVILFFMTLQMLGLIDSIISLNNSIKIPQCLQNHRYLPFFYGIFSGTITSPCVSPGLIAILSLVSQQNNIFIGWLWLFTFGIGLSLPLLLIALVINSEFIFPKSGSWMNELKEIIGLILIFIVNNNIIRLANDIIAFIISSTILLIFLINKYRTFDKSENPHKYWFCSFSSVIAMLLFSFSSISFYQKHTTATTSNITIEKINWHNSFDQAITQAAAENKLLLIDFTAEWCSICQIVDKEIFKNSTFMENLNNYYTFCKIDCTHTDNNKESLLKQYQINGFPTLLILNPKNQKEMKRFSGEILDIEKSTFMKISEEMHKKIQ